MGTEPKEIGESELAFRYSKPVRLKLDLSQMVRANPKMKLELELNLGLGMGWDLNWVRNYGRGCS